MDVHRKNIKTALYKANKYLRSNNPLKAENIYRRLLKTVHDAKGEINFNLAVALLERGQHSEAASHFRKSLGINPESSQTHYYFAVTQAALGDDDEAIKSCCQAVKIEPQNTTYLDGLAQLLGDLGRNDEAVKIFKKAVATDSKDTNVLNNLGSALDRQGRFAEAKEVFSQACESNPDDSRSFFNLANVLLQLGLKKDSISAYRRAAELSPENDCAEMMLASQTGVTPSRPPKDYVETLFNQYATYFEEHVTGSLEYRAPKHLLNLLQGIVGTTKSHSRVLDLGCGTGLSGEEFRPVSKHLTGVDLSTSMLDLAREKNLYNRLYRGEIHEFLDTVKERYDLFVASDVLIYVGNLDRFFSLLKARARRGAFFVFTIEETTKGDFFLQSNTRFAHSRCYIEALSATHGFKIEKCESEFLRAEFDNAIDGLYYVLRYQS